MPQPSLFRGFKNGGPTIFERTIFERVLDIIRIKIRHLKGEKQMGKLWNIRFNWSGNLRTQSNELSWISLNVRAISAKIFIKKLLIAR